MSLCVNQRGCVKKQCELLGDEVDCGGEYIRYEEVPLTAHGAIGTQRRVA